MGSATGRQSLAVATAEYKGGLLLSWNIFDFSSNPNVTSARSAFRPGTPSNS